MFTIRLVQWLGGSSKPKKERKLETRPLIALGFSQSRTLCFYYVASSPGSPLPHLRDGQRKLSVGCIAIPARSYPRLVWYPWESIVEVVRTPWPNLQVTSTTPTCYKASHMLNHHTHPTDPIRDKNAFDTSSTRVLRCFIDPRVCCFVLLTRGWGRLETRPPFALGSSPELFAFTMSLAFPVRKIETTMTKSDPSRTVQNYVFLRFFSNKTFIKR